MLDFLRRNASGPFGLALIILLVLAFSVWGIGDIFRNYDSGTLARIGDRDVDSQEFLFRYNREINRLSNELERFISNEEARELGLDIQVLSNLIIEKTLNSLIVKIIDNELEEFSSCRSISKKHVESNEIWIYLQNNFSKKQFVCFKAKKCLTILLSIKW